MNNKHFHDWIETVKSATASDEIHNQIDTLRKRRSSWWVIKVLCACVVTLFLFFGIGVNISKSFYIYALNTPFGSLASTLRVVEDTYHRSIEADKYQAINKSLIIEGEEVTIKGLIVESKSVLLIVESETSNNLRHLNVKVNEAVQSQTPVELQYSGYSTGNVITYTFDTVINDADTFSIYNDSEHIITVVIDGSKAIEAKRVVINETMQRGESQVTLNDLVFGGIKSILNVHVTPPRGYTYNTMKIRLITDRGEQIEASSSGTKQGSSDVMFEYETGQLIDEDIRSIEIYYISWIEEKHKQIVYDITTNLFDYLPESIQFIGRFDAVNNFTFKFRNLSSNPHEVTIPLSYSGNSTTYTDDKGFIYIEVQKSDPIIFNSYVGDLVDTSGYVVVLE